MPATGARRGHLVYHWKHGFIPLDHYAALKKAHGSDKGAAKVAAKFGIAGHDSHHTHPVGATVAARQPGIERETHGTVVGHDVHGFVKVEHTDRKGNTLVGTFNPEHTRVVGSETPHPEPHTLKPGDRATVQGVDEHGAPTRYTGEVRGTTAVTASRGSKKTPMLGITVQRESPTTGRMRHDTVYVPDPNRDPAKIDAARKAGAARDQLRRDLNAKYAGQGAPYMRQQHGIDPAAMSNADLAKYRESLHAEHDHVLLSDGKRLRDKMDAEHVSRRNAKLTERTRAAQPAAAKQQDNMTKIAAAGIEKDFRSMTPTEKVRAAEIMYGTGSRQHTAAIAKFGAEPPVVDKAEAHAKVRDLSAGAEFKGVHSEVYRGNKISVRKGREWGTLQTSINGNVVSPSALGRSNGHAVRELDGLRGYIDLAHKDPGSYGIGTENPTWGMKLEKAPKANLHADRAAQLREAAAKKRAEAERIAGSVGAPDRAGAMLRAKDSARMNARMDSGLRRYTEKQREASALESKAHLADGRAKSAAEKQNAADLALTPSKLSRGDLIQHKGQAHMVTKVNKTTVSVPSIVGGSWEDKVPIGGISQHIKLSDMKESTLRTLMSRAKGNDALQAIYAAELKRRGLL